MICNKNHPLHLVGVLFPHINDDARSKPHQKNDMNIDGPSLEGSVLMLENRVSRKWSISFKCFNYSKVKRS